MPFLPQKVTLFVPLHFHYVDLPLWFGGLTGYTYVLALLVLFALFSLREASVFECRYP